MKTSAHDPIKVWADDKIIHFTRLASNRYQRSQLHLLFTFELERMVRGTGEFFSWIVLCMYQLKMYSGKFKQKRGGGRNFRCVNVKWLHIVPMLVSWFVMPIFTTFSCSKDMASDRGGERTRWVLFLGGGMIISDDLFWLRCFERHITMTCHGDKTWRHRW